MERRSFLARILRLAGLTALPSAVFADAPAMPRPEPRPALLLQASRLAGFQYHQGEAHWAEIHVGAPLTLARDPENRYDARAIRVDWQGHKLGYVPRVENATLASLMDRGHKLAAVVRTKRESPDPWQRIEFEVYLAG